MFFQAVITMADLWIVSNYKFREHQNWESADEEARRLRKKTGQKFRIYRIKTTVVPAGTYFALLEEIAQLRLALSQAQSESELTI